MKKDIKAFIKEIVPIIVGILIAMYITNWNENRKEKKYINQIFLSINKELTETNEDIIDKISIQKSFIDTLDFYLEDNKISLLDITIKANGIYIPTIKINSWKAISNSRIELVEHNKVSALANIEEQKEILKMKTEKLANFLYSNTKETGKEKKEFMKIMMLDIIGTEIPLQKEIEKIIND
ncbi:MAG: hypothetical protein JEZ09_18540 [Salinivirgaceae bacterium]|nr:hypothetical protein [Salinivirgaceae bacterium]